MEDAVIAVACSVVGAIVASRRPRNPIGWILCALGLLGGIRLLSAEYAIYDLLVSDGSLQGGEALAWIVSWSLVPLLGLFMFTGLLFPNGRPLNRGWRWFAWAGAAVTLVGSILAAFSPGQIEGISPLRNPLGIEEIGSVAAPIEVILYAFELGALTSLFQRLHRAGGEERQQLKWVTYAAAVAVGGAILKYVVAENISVAEIIGVPLVSWAGFTLAIAGIAGIPIAMGVAILKHHLYDIDRIINRTLVYAALTVSLALVYVGSIVALQGAFRALTGGESQLAVVASTLAIAALFGPLRHRFQGFIDHRFYRRKYDAARVLAAFSAKLRDETDLDALGEDLVEVVRETMQPEHVSLWLRKPVDNKSPGVDS